MKEKIKELFRKIYNLSMPQRIILLTIIVLLFIGIAVFAINQSEPMKIKLAEVATKLTKQDGASEEVSVSTELKKEIDDTRPFILPDQDLIARFDFDEPKGDTVHVTQGSCENSCNGTLLDFPDLKKQDAAENSGWTFIKRFLGKGALMFEGNNYVKVPDSQKLVVPGSVTFETWIKVRDIKDWSRILAWRHGADNVQLGFYKNEKKIVAQVKRAGKQEIKKGENGAEDQVITSGEVLLTKKVKYPLEVARDAWMHIAIVEIGRAHV